jgi:cytidylate kinase
LCHIRKFRPLFLHLQGKGTIAKRLATEQQLAHLDTGLLYRGVGWAALSANTDLSDEQALADLAANLNLAELENNKQLRGDQAAVAASKVSVLPAVRAALLQAQRKFANEPPAGFQGERKQSETIRLHQ